MRLLIPDLKPITPSHDETYGGLCVQHKEDGWKIMHNDNPIVGLIETTHYNERYDFKLDESTETWYYGSPNSGIGIYHFNGKWNSNAVVGNRIVFNESLDRSRVIKLGIDSYRELKNEYIDCG